jgi:1,4-dihydroxy-2-naphthoyl-CoA hydrolase
VRYTLAAMTEKEPEDFAEFANQNPDGWMRATGLRFVRATRDEVIAELEIAPHHLQALGLVHGGVHAGIIETICSFGAAINAFATGSTVVGLENHTSFLRAARSGTIRANAKPIARGRRSQVWEATITDADGRALATGRVRLIVLERGAEVAGEPIQFKPSQT